MFKNKIKRKSKEEKRETGNSLDLTGAKLLNASYIISLLFSFPLLLSVYIDICTINTLVVAYSLFLH